MSEEEQVLDTETELTHIGTSRHSGRYPWGSGQDPKQRGRDFLGNIVSLQKQGLSELDIAKGMGLTVQELRNKKTIHLNARKAEDAATALKLKTKGYSNVAIGEKMGKNESSVRALLNPVYQERAKVINNTANMIKESVAKNKYIDIGVGAETHIGVSRTKLKAVVSMLEDEGYKQHEVYFKQMGTGKYTKMLVLTKADVPTAEVNKNQDKIKMIGAKSTDGGLTFVRDMPIHNIDSKRIKIRYAEEGGTDKDGVIELRRNVEDLSLGKARYAQVRVSVDGTHFLKGMAMYSDDMPDGYDIVFNTNKHQGTPKEKVFKPLKDDPDNPFGSSVIASHYVDANGQTKRSGLNIVNQEGDWETWKKNLSSQVLSKQPVALIKKQLGLALDLKNDEFEELTKLTNPVIKKHLLAGEGGFADDCDSSAVHLKAAALPRQASHVILPILSVKENEVYAPNFIDGEPVVLIRHPHGGIFEIPQLIVNNKNPEANRLIGNARDAIGIHPKVATKLSGADFDGDTVLVIPNKDGNIKSKPALDGLKNFVTTEAYPAYEGMPKMTPKQKAMEMGNISNLITDMTIRGANTDEICRAVKHSMVVIDAEKHNLNYKLSALENNIGQLKEKYQGSKKAGASTLISKAGSDYRIPDQKYGVKDPVTGKVKYVDPGTGEKLYTQTGKTYLKPVQKIITLPDGTKQKAYTVLPNGKKQKIYETNPDGTIKTKVMPKMIKTTKMAVEKDAFNLSSGEIQETAYAHYANGLKALANKARQTALSIRPTLYSPSANKLYAKEVESLNSKLKLAFMNKPLERQAQLLANKTLRAKIDANPGMDEDDIKKEKGKALIAARARIGAQKQKIVIDDREWEAIQSGAISSNALTQIILNSDLEKLKERAMPRTSRGLSAARVARAKSMLSSGYTQAEVANALGVSVSTLLKGVE